MRYPTKHVGNADLVLTRVVSIAFCRLVGLLGHNNAAADLYIQVHETAAVPSADAVPVFSVLANSELPYSFALPAPVDLSACTIVASTAVEKYTATTGTPVTIQALLAN
jgi:hypothetical protein